MSLRWQIEEHYLLGWDACSHSSLTIHRNTLSPASGWRKCVSPKRQLISAGLHRVQIREVFIVSGSSLFGYWVSFFWLLFSSSLAEENGKRERCRWVVHSYFKVRNIIMYSCVFLKDYWVRDFDVKPKWRLTRWK